MKKLFQFVFTVFFTLSFSISILAQLQVGENINGELAGDNFGWSTAISGDGSRVVVGAHGNDSGYAQIFEWSGTSWIQLGNDIIGEAFGDQSGEAVAISSDGNRVAIGAHLNDANGDDSGHVRIFEWNGSSWVQMGIDIDGDDDTDFFGGAVSLSTDGSRVAIGAVRGASPGLGHVKIYEWNGVSWIQLGNNINGEVAQDFSGYAVSLSGDGTRVIISANRNDENGFDAGAARVYEWNNVSWNQMGNTLYGEDSSNYFGRSVSISNDGLRIAIGAPSNNNANGSSAGHVRVFEWSGNNWNQLGIDIDGQEAGEHLGESVSLSANGNRVVIGAYEANEFAGSVRVFEWSNGSWNQIGGNINGENAGDTFGRSVYISTNGKYVASGAPNNDDNGERAGHVRVFDVTIITSTDFIHEKKINIYPNPTTGLIELRGSEFGAIKIIDSYGRVIWRVEKPESEIDISSLASGIYFIQFSSENQLITKKIIKK